MITRPTQQGLNMNVFKIVKRSRFVFPLACVAATAVVLVSEGTYWQSVNTLDRLGAMGEAGAAIQGLERRILDAETGQRGYLLTGRTEYSKPYYDALKEIEQAFRFLEHYYANEPASLEVLGKLRALTDTRLSELALTMRLYEEGKNRATHEIVMSNIGKEQMDAIRQLDRELLKHETQKVAAGRDNHQRALLLSRIGVAALSAIGLLALFLYLRQTSAYDKQQQEQQRLVQAERDRLEVEVMRRTARLTELTRHLQTAREDERNSLARDLHDELGALLTAAKLDAARIKSRLGGSAPEAQALLSHMVEMLNSGIALKRRIIEDLRPSSLSNLGLVPALENLLGEFAQRAGILVQSELAPVNLDPAAQLVIYRLVQEATTNITKYAHAKQVWVSMAASNGQVKVSVRDDGKGFDPNATSGSAYGLEGMRFRVEAKGGTMALVSRPGQGTLIQVSLPESDAIDH